MDAINEDQIKKLLNRHQELKARVYHLTETRNSLITQLKSEFGVDSLAAAKEKLESMKGELQQLETDLSQKVTDCQLQLAKYEAIVGIADAK